MGLHQFQPVAGPGADPRRPLAATLARPLPRPHVAIPLIASRFQDGQLSDATTLEMLQAALADLLAEIRLLAAARG